MLVKFLPTKNGGGLGSVNYLLNIRKEEGIARILKGNEAQTRAIINQIEYKQKTTFGVLSFSEKADSIDDKVKLEIIKDFERHLVGDYMKNRVNFLWVEHSDKDGRLELNFLIPKIDLLTGKSFNPYFDKRDRTNINLWKRTINDEYGFSSPDDPKNQYNQNRHKATLDQHNTIMELDNALKSLVSQGAIKNRSHMIELLNNNGYKVIRSPKSGISIKLPNQKKPFRLRGGIYSAEFTDITGLSKLDQTQSRRIEQYANRDTQTECIANRKRLERFISKRDERNKKRYKEQVRPNVIANKEHERGDNKANLSKLSGKNFKWHNVSNSDSIFHSRFFNQLLFKQQRGGVLQERDKGVKNGEQNTKTVANSHGLQDRSNKSKDKRIREIFNNSTQNSDTSKGWLTILKAKRGVVDDAVRDRVIKRDREIAERNFKIAERDREQTRREQKFRKHIRKFAEQESSFILQRLSGEFQARVREHSQVAQQRAKQKREQNRKLRERTKRDREYQKKLNNLLQTCLTADYSKLESDYIALQTDYESLENELSQIKIKLETNLVDIQVELQRVYKELEKQLLSEIAENLERVWMEKLKELLPLVDLRLSEVYENPNAKKW